MTSRLRPILLCCLLMLPSPWIGAAAQEAPLPPAVRRVISNFDLPSHSYALVVRQVGEAQPLLAVNAELPLNPASTIKTLTTLAGLEELGPDYRWRTALYALGPVVDGTLEGDLLLRGGGDPFLTEDGLRGMLKALQRRGVERIAGDLVIDASLFDPSVGQDGRIDNESNRAYNVLPHALMLNFQVVNFHFIPHANGRDVVIHSDPRLPNLSINNRLRVREGACSGFQRGIAFSEEATAATVTFEGQFPSGCTDYVLTRSVLDAPSYAFGLFRQLWSELGGDFAGDWRAAVTPEGLTPLVEWESVPLGDVIKSINKFSNNMMTRHLLLTLGLERYGAPATVEKGAQALHDYLDALGIARDALVIGNGSGLARETRVSAALLAEILERGYTIPTMAEFVASLPLSGTDGTMRERLRAEGPAASMHVKTGSLDGVAGVAGYVHARSGRQFVVVAILNHAQADRGPGQELGDALLRWAWEQ